MVDQTGSFGYDRDFSGLYDAVTGLIKDYLKTHEDRDSKVIEFLPPSQLRELVDVSVPEEGVEETVVVELVKTVLKYSVHTAHPRFYNQLFSGIDQVGMLGQFITAALNTSMYTYEMAPVLTLIEMEVLEQMRALVGWSDGDGIFTPGGSFANWYGLLTARYHKFPESKKKGIWHLPRLLIFVSEDSHYSIKKGAIMMGAGLDSLVAVKCNSGKMDTGDLEWKIEDAKSQGHMPYVVVATAGTTVLGAFDPLEDIADVCERHGLWLHVDAAHGGSCLFSDRHRGLMAGVERADSVTWDMHKGVVAPFQCSAFLLRHKGLLKECNSTNASYLFQSDKGNYDVSYDTGDKSLQCGRVNDVLKLWLMWKAKGKQGFARHIENSISMGKYLAEEVRKREGFQLIVEPEYTNVSFWYIPPSIRHLTDGPERRDKLSKVAPCIKTKMVERGNMMIQYQPLHELPNFIRMITIAPHSNKQDMDYVLDEIEQLGKDL